MPIISPEREQRIDDALCRTRCPCAYSSSRCSAAGLCVIAVKKTLSASVTVRRIGMLEFLADRKFFEIETGHGANR